MDDELSVNARQLIDFAMDADVPPAVVVEGSWGMVVSRLTLETESERAPTKVVVVPPSRRRKVITIGIVLVIAAVAAVWLSSRAGPSARRTLATNPPGVPVTTATPTVTVPATPPSPPAATSAEQLLDDADARLSDQPLRALDLVDRHAELAPTRDADRRMALRIAVLCALGRTADANAEATAFLGIPRTPASTARVRASCVAH